MSEWGARLMSLCLRNGHVPKWLYRVVQALVFYRQRDGVGLGVGEGVVMGVWDGGGRWEVGWGLGVWVGAYDIQYCKKQQKKPSYLKYT